MTELYTMSAGGFSAAADAFVRDEQQDELWFVSILGAQTALKAIAGSLLKNHPDPAYLIAAEENEERVRGQQRCHIAQQALGTWTFRMSRLPSSRGWHMMIYTRMAEYSFDRKEFLLLARDIEEAPSLHHRFLDRRIALPMHESWAPWLWQWGTRNGAIKTLQSEGVRGFLCTPDEQQLSEDVSSAVSAGDLTAPGED